ncbi:MAG: Eco57I restriction-modification methylase domain-containing protein, partial [Burkholderiales bacterium]
VLQQGEFSRVEAATSSMERIAELTDVDVAEVHQSRRLLEQTDLELAPLNALLDLWRSLRWLNPGWPRARQMEDRGLAELLSGRHDLMQVMQTGGLTEEGRDIDAANSLLEKARDLAAREHFLHWQTAFPAVWADRARRGFDAVIGNPPWDRIKLQEVEWFAERKPEIAKAARASDRRRMIEALKEKEDPLWRECEAAKDTAETAARVFRECGDYPLLSTGDMNLYCLFVERAQSLVHPRGMVGLLTPSGIAADKGAADFFRTLTTPPPFTGEDEGARLAALFDFENRNNPGGSYFPDVDSRFKFCTLVFGGENRAFAQSRCAFYLHDVRELANADRILALSAADFAAVNPNTGGAPIFRTKRDAEITTGIYRRQPVFVDRRSNSQKKVWPVRYVTMFHMTNDSRLFLRRDELEKRGWYPVEHNRYKKGEAIALPLYEGKMVQMYDHRAANVVVNAANVHRPAQQEAVSLAHHRDPKFSPQPQFWVGKSDVDNVYSGEWIVGFKEITAPTNERSMIACLAPGVGFGNKLPLWIPEEDTESRYSSFGPLLLANLNAFVFDFVVRQKLQGQTLNLFIVEQLPLIRPEQFEAKIDETTIADFVRGEVLRLSYSAWDLQPFARDLGYDGPPFKWDEDDRRHRIARLDALFFRLYGISRDDAAYILDTFPIVREQDERAFGRYLTKDMILAYMNAVAAGDFNTLVSI